MLALFAVALAASTSSPVLEASVPWWERITVTMDDKGEQRSCHYEMSLSTAGAKSCDEETAASLGAGGDGPKGVYSKVTYERRFSPGGQIDSGQLRPGDTLLGRRVMFLTIDAAGSIDSCKVVAASGDMAFRYDCEQVRKEQFQVQAPRQAFMTILAYGHTEQIA